MQAEQSSQSSWGYWLLAIVAIATIATITTIAIKPDHYYQWDFRVYYHAAKLDAQGLDPYDTDLLQKTADLEHHHPFAYPPSVLLLFRPLTAFSYGTAYLIWLGIKVLALLWLLYIWHKYLFADAPPPHWYLFLLVSFGGAVCLDMIAGNVSVIEQALLWSGFAALLRKKVWLFCLMVLAAAIFKWTMILLLLVLIPLGIEHRYRYLLISAIAMVCMIAVSALPDLERFSHFLSTVLGVDERGDKFNPSLLSLIRDLTDKLRVFSVPGYTINLLSFAVWGVFGWWLISRTLKWFAAAKDEPLRSIETIYMTTLVYALVMPRFKLYSFILILPALYHAIRRYVRPSHFVLLFLLIAICSPPVIPSAKFFTKMAWYWPTIITLGVWYYWLKATRQTNRLTEVEPDR